MRPLPHIQFEKSEYEFDSKEVFASFFLFKIVFIIKEETFSFKNGKNMIVFLFPAYGSTIVPSFNRDKHCRMHLKARKVKTKLKRN